MKVDELKESITLNGITVRTKNENEMNPSTAKIALLWEKFFSEIAPSLIDKSKVYGVYSNYESDASGEFDLTASTDQEIENSKSISINSGKYLVFSAKGDMPKVVIDTWGEIWNYFSNEKNQHERAYITDFEFYKNEQEIEIYIGIK